MFRLAARAISHRAPSPQSAVHSHSHQTCVQSQLQLLRKRVQLARLRVSVVAAGAAGGTLLSGQFLLPGEHPFSAVARCDGGGDGGSNFLKYGCCCVLTVAGGLASIVAAGSYQVEVAAQMLAVASRQVPLRDDDSVAAISTMRAALKNDQQFREQLTPEQQDRAALVMVELARLSFGLAIMSEKLRSVPEGFSLELRNKLLENQYVSSPGSSKWTKPSLSVPVLIHATGLFVETTMLRADPPALWKMIATWVCATAYAMDTTKDGILDWGEWVDLHALALSQLCAGSHHGRGSEAGWRAQRFFALMTANDKQKQGNVDLAAMSVGPGVSGGAGGVRGEVIPLPTLARFLRSAVVIGLLPINQISPKYKEHGVLRRFRTNAAAGGVYAAGGESGIDAALELAQEICAELQLGPSAAEGAEASAAGELEGVTLMELANLIEKKFDFENWDAMCEDVRGELGPPGMPGGGGVALVLCMQAQELLASVLAHESTISESERENYAKKFMATAK